MIKIIHQISKNGLISPELIHYVDSVKKHHSDWEYILWSDDNDKLIKEEYYFIWDNYKKVKGIQKADIARYCILHKYGGLYIDTDMLFYKNIEPLIYNKTDIILAPSIPTLPGFTNTVTNYIIYCGKKNNPFWIILLKEINERLKICDNWWYNLSILNPIIIPYSTGRVVLSKFINKNYFTSFDCNLVVDKFSPYNNFNTYGVYCVHEGGTVRNNGKSWGNCLEYYFVKNEFKIRRLLNIKQDICQVPLFTILLIIVLVCFLLLHNI